MLILSPHLDDAVLSCWHLLAGPGEATVLNVFDGTPPDGTPLPWWDTLTGASDPVTRMAERRAEDARARAELGRDAISLGLLDAQYRAEPASAADLARRLSARVAEGAVVYAPAGIEGCHADHLAVRDAAIALAGEGRRLRLYADLPHAIRCGWPAWVTGEAEEPGVSAAWAETFAAAGLLVDRLVPRVHPLSPADRRRKLHLLSLYATQRRALDAICFRPFDDPRTLAYEVTWDVPPQALASRAGVKEPAGEPVVPDPGAEPLRDLA